MEAVPSCVQAMSPLPVLFGIRRLSLWLSQAVDIIHGSYLFGDAVTKYPLLGNT